jgi:hypothetical protein
VDPSTVAVEVRPGVANQVLVAVHLGKPKKDLYQVLNLRDGAIVHIQDYRRAADARQAAGVRS